MGWSKLVSGILDSSIWDEPYPTRIVWVAMLARKDHNGFVGAAISGVARFANVTREEAEEAIKCLESPDQESRSKEHGGRRIIPVDGGWMVVNHNRYREFSYSDHPEAIKKRRQRGTIGDMSPLCPEVSPETGCVPNLPGHSVSVSSSLSSSSSSEREGEVKPTGRCRRMVSVDGTKASQLVPCLIFGDYVHLTEAEFGKMLADWGPKFTQAAIGQYDDRIPNSPAAKKHTDHNRGIRDYVRRGYICAGLKPEPRKQSPKPSPSTPDAPPTSADDWAEIQAMARATRAFLQAKKQNKEPQ